MKLLIKQDTKIVVEGYVWNISKDFWTTCDNVAIGINNLKKQIAKTDRYDIRKWTTIDIDFCDIKIF